MQEIKLNLEEIEKLGFVFRNTPKQYGWYLEVSKNRVLTWCHSNEISLEFDTETYDYNNTLFDFKVEFISQAEKLIELFKKN